MSAGPTSGHGTSIPNPPPGIVTSTFIASTITNMSEKSIAASSVDVVPPDRLEGALRHVLGI